MRMAYLWVHPINQVDGFSNLAGMNRVTNLHTVTNAIRVKGLGDVGLLSKFCSSSGISF
jgi:hypothetical protein